MSGTSMVPHLRPGAIIIATGFYAALHPGDVVIIEHDGLEKIKRLSKIEGNRIYILGDNPKSSTDSRHLGWLPITAVTARVIWPHKTVRLSRYRQAAD